MKIKIGSLIGKCCQKGKKNKKMVLAVDIPGIGIKESEEDKDDYPFHSIILTLDDLYILLREIEREIFAKENQNDF